MARLTCAPRSRGTAGWRGKPASDLSSKTTEELASLLYAKAAPTPAAVPPAPKKPKQRVVKLDELDQALAEGWAFKSELRDGRILIEAET